MLKFLSPLIVSTDNGLADNLIIVYTEIVMK